MARQALRSKPLKDQVSAIVERLAQAFLALSILWVVYRYCWIDVIDPFKCGALLNQGEWLDPGSRWSSPYPYQNWQPPGCLMHDYKKKDIHECFHNRRLIFIGDSTTRQIFWAVARKLDQEKAEEEITDMMGRDTIHEDLEVESSGVSVQFIWDPFLNSTRLDVELQKFSASSSTQPDGPSNGSAALMLLGSPGLWFARHDQNNYMKGFRDSVENVIQYMDHEHIVPAEDIDVAARPFDARQGSPNLLLLAPIQVPHYESLSPSREETITPEKIDQMTDFLQQVSAYSDADVLWSYSLMTWNGGAQYEDSGLHVIESVAQRKADVLLNLRCNANPSSDRHPYGRSCCSNYTRPNETQWVMILTTLVILPVLLSFRRGHTFRLGRYLPATHNLNALTLAGLVICFCFYADRTQIFEKSQRQFRHKEFVALCSAVATAGLLSVRKSKDQRAASKDDAFHQPVLSRDQTEEWKGWMQFIILIYHYYHGSTVLWLYEIVRLLIASYLFMTGFGHTTYLLKSGDYSIKRVASVLARLNLLSCVLPYMMRTDYTFYYFASLVTFWFLIIYCTLYASRHRNSSLTFLLGKILLSSMLITAFTRVPGILETISLILNKTCSISWDVHEWRFRTSLDLYVVYIGMLLAALNIRRTQLSFGSVKPITLLDQIVAITTKFQGTCRGFVVILSIGLLAGFWALIRRSPDKEDYNWWHPYISFIPVLCFVALRNCHYLLRDYHSAVFAWLGRCSLETYILQYHIWLAGDTQGLLSLGLGHRRVEAMILTPIFLWISWHTSKASQTLISWALGTPTFSKCLGDDKWKERDPYLLPSTTEDDGLPSIVSKTVDQEKRSDLWNHKSSIQDKIQWKMGLVLMLMWLANVTYR